MSLSPREPIAGVVAVLASVIAVALAGCQGDTMAGASVDRPSLATASSALAPVAVAVVNGTPITAADLALAMATAARAANPHAAGDVPAAPPARDQVLDGLIRDELAAQRARARGLDGNREYLDELTTMHAQLDGFRRQRLASLLEREVRDHAEVSEAEARRFFDQRGDGIRTVTRVWQILLHDREAIERAHRDIVAGARFEVVAGRQFPQLPAGATPWDLGELKWNQVPEPWSGVIGGLAVGDMSAIIEGPRGRLWIIKVVARRVDPAITFETARPAITTLLRSQAAERAQAELERSLWAGAIITRAAKPPAEP